MVRDLIFDVGMYDGSDTDYYLRKGFRVVAIEADQHLVEKAEARFRGEIQDGRLKIVAKAIAERSGSITFFRSKVPLWSTACSARSAFYGMSRKVESEPVEVACTTLADVMREHGVPYYAKIDIEGMDKAALASLHAVDRKPAFVSIESERRDLQSVREELALLQTLGYERFQVVAQHRVHRQTEPTPAREGRQAGNPRADTSGLFGRDLPGHTWLSADGALAAYRRPLLNHYLTGSDPLIGNRWVRAGLKRLGFRAGWYDTHARHKHAAA
ncbi:FkbM family methyltransferase [Prosthecomicrobium sp. N25]|uniref:FkbM family methyltransferase n=1 Tax=Prosthecomicrobium sp. N25 TaxID=3129254 RepID=UPI00307703EE